MDQSEQTRIRQIIIETFKGGEGSGNFGHVGRPGEVGGSASENIVIGKTYIHKKPVTKVVDARYLLDGTYTIAIGTKGKNKGTVLAAPGTLPHSEVIKVFDKTATVDDYARFNSSHGRIYANQKYAGIYGDDADFSTKSMDNIYQCSDTLVNLGLPKNTPLEIWLANGSIKFYEITLKMIRMKDGQSASI